MGIDWFRDLIICIFGIVAAGVLIFLAVLSYSLYRRVKSILDSTRAAASNIQDISSYMGEEIIKPLIQIVAVIQGIRQGIDSVSKFFKK